MHTRWHVRRLLDSPHRLEFAAAASVLATAAVFWAGLLVWPVSGRPGTMPASTAHGLLFVFGFMPLFFAGFLFTVGPRWLGHTMDEAGYAALVQRMRTPVLACAAAWLAWSPAWLLANAVPEGEHHATGTAFALTSTIAALVPAVLLTLAAVAWSLVVARLAGIRREAAAHHGVPHLWTLAREPATRSARQSARRIEDRGAAPHRRHLRPDKQSST